MVITFLGTGTSQGVPVIGCDCAVCTSDDPRDNRLRTAILVESRGKTIVVDTGPDFREQMLRNKVKSIDAVLLTHGHKDHIGGLDDLRAYNFMLKRPIDIFAGTDVQNSVKSEFFYAFVRDKYPGVPQIILHTIDNEPFAIDNIPVIPISVLHFKMHVFGFRFGDFTYITDASYISYEEKQKIVGSKVIVINALRKQLHYSHFNLEQAVALLQELNPRQGYLTHMSHLLGKHADIEKELPDFIKPAYDGLKLEL